MRQLAGLVVVAFVMALPAGAQAREVAAFPWTEATAGQIGGPALTGDAVVWAVHTGGGAVEVHRATSSGRSTRLLRIPPPRRGRSGAFARVTLAASSQRIALQRQVVRVENDDPRLETTLVSDVWTAAVDGPFVRIAEPEDCTFIWRALDVEADAIAYDVHCGSVRRIVVRDFAAGARAPVVELGRDVIGPRGPLRLTGGLVAWVEEDFPRRNAVVVADRLSGAIVARHPGIGPEANLVLEEFELGADGAIVAPSVAPSGDAVRLVRSPPDAGPRTVIAGFDEPFGGGYTRPALAGDAVAGWRFLGRGAYELLVRPGTENPRRLATLRYSERTGDVAFDGSRTAWAAAACGRTAVLLSRLGDARARAPRCRLSLRLGSQYVTRGGAIRLRARCPGRGYTCALKIFLSPERPVREVAIRAGRARTVAVPLPAEKRGELRESARVQVPISVFATDSRGTPFGSGLIVAVREPR